MLDLLAKKIAARLEIKPEDVARRISTREIAHYMPRQKSRCPVCEGRGAVPEGFYLANPQFVWASSQAITVIATDGHELCRQCLGHGVIP